MSDRRSGATGEAHEPTQADRRRGIRRTAIALALLAVGFYVAFIVVTGAGVN